MRIASLVVVAALAALTGQGERADACSISPEPAAHVFGSTAGEPGVRPWITLWNVRVTEAVTLSVVTLDPVAVTPTGEGCAPGLVCKGKAVAFDREGKFLRPKADLPAGARVQVLLGKKLIADTVIKKGGATALPVWNGIDVTKVSAKTTAMCSSGGPEVVLKIKPSKARLENAIGLFYLTRPDPKAPHKNLSAIEAFGYDNDITLNNDFDNNWLTGGGPKELWMLLADDAGNVGAPIKLI
jgi:hypothetical protein